MPTETVFVVDDDRFLAEAYEAGLIAAGFSVALLGDAEAMFRDLDVRHPDAVVLDWVMPGMGGGEALRRLARDCRADGVPVLIMSNLPKTQNPAVEQALGDGAVAWLEKLKTSPSELAVALSTVLGRGQPAGTA